MTSCDDERTSILIWKGEETVLLTEVNWLFQEQSWGQIIVLKANLGSNDDDEKLSLRISRELIKLFLHSTYREKGLKKKRKKSLLSFLEIEFSSFSCLEKQWQRGFVAAPIVNAKDRREKKIQILKSLFFFVCLIVW